MLCHGLNRRYPSSEALEEPHHVAQPRAPPFAPVDRGVQPCDNAAGLPVDAGVRHQVQPGIKEFQTWHEAGQSALCDPAPPAMDAPQPIRLRAGRIEDRG